MLEYIIAYIERESAPGGRRAVCVSTPRVVIHYHSEWYASRVYICPEKDEGCNTLPFLFTVDILFVRW